MGATAVQGALGDEESVANGYLAEVAKRIEELGIEVEYEVRHGRAAKELVAATKPGDLDRDRVARARWYHPLAPGQRGGGARPARGGSRAAREGDEGCSGETGGKQRWTQHASWKLPASEPIAVWRRARLPMAQVPGRSTWDRRIHRPVLAPRHN